MERRSRREPQWEEYVVWMGYRPANPTRPTVVVVEEEGREFLLHHMRRTPRPGERIRVLAHHDWADIYRVLLMLTDDEVLYDINDADDTPPSSSPAEPP